ncbi:MAG: PleD family two-component system response regulator [Paracoccaceae bacterium]
MSISTGTSGNAVGQSASKSRSNAKMRVLVVDDELSILELLKAALSALGDFEVSIASSGADALKLVNGQKNPFDCFLLDIQMPQMNGITLCQELRMRSEYRHAPVIMLTAMSEKKYVDQAFTAGATDYVTKPFDLLELRSRLGTARQLVEEHSRAADSIAVARKLKEELDTNLQFSFEDPITIEGIERVLGFTEFENYVMQLSRRHRFNSYVTGVMIDAGRKLHAEISSSDFRDSLHDVAHAISKLTKNEESMLSYRGNGMFLAITYGKQSVLPQEATTQLNQLVGTLQARRRTDYTVRLVIGEPVCTRALTKFGALYSINKAIENVESQDASSKDVVKFSKRMLQDRVRPDDKASRERRAYQAVLQELLQEDRTLSQR